MQRYATVDDQLIYSLISYLRRRNISLKKTKKLGCRQKAYISLKKNLKTRLSTKSISSYLEEISSHNKQALFDLTIAFNSQSNK